MIRIYCDSNIFRKLKPSSKQFNQEVFDHFENIRNNAVLTFSEAHLDDLRTSKEIYRDEDLMLMEKYTSDIYIFYNQHSKKWDCFNATPKEAFADRDFVAFDRALSNPFDFRSLVADIGDFPGKEQICAVMDNFMRTPISVFGLTDIPVVDTESNKNMLEKVLPGYSPDMGIGEFFLGMQPFMSRLFEDHKEFDELRRNITTFVDSNDYKYEKWGLAFDEQLEKSAIGKKFTDIIRQMNTGIEKDDWRQFHQAYTMLEMMGITEERSSQKRKKNNLSDLTKDCAHAFNAMSCDYFITDDKGLLVKAQILYHIFQVNRTRIITLDELSQFDLAQPIDASLNKLIPFLHSLPFTFKEDTNESNYYFETKFLHYFDVVTRIKTNEKAFILRASKDWSLNFINREIVKICDKVTELLGDDGFGKGRVDIKELEEAEGLVPLRIWRFEDCLFELKCNKSAALFFIVITFS